jgi:hypothetical protein
VIFKVPTIEVASGDLESIELALQFRLLVPLKAGSDRVQVRLAIGA